jgi:hypothetical protein
MEKYDSDAREESPIQKSYANIDLMAKKNGILSEVVDRMKKYCTGAAVSSTA